MRRCQCSFGEILCYLTDQAHCMPEILVILGVLGAVAGSIMLCCCCCCCCKKCVKALCCCPCQLAKAIIRCCSKCPCWKLGRDHGDDSDSDIDEDDRRAHPTKAARSVRLQVKRNKVVPQQQVRSQAQMRTPAVIADNIGAYQRVLVVAACTRRELSDYRSRRCS